MRIETYRGVPFVDREEELEFLADYFASPPQRLLFIYGPKSSGKTTVIEYLVENHLVRDEKYWVKYLNLREALISSYGSFLDTFFVPVDMELPETEASLGFNIIGFKAEILQKIKSKQENLFKAFIRKIREVNDSSKRPILIIDEIQKLQDLYITNGNSERELLKEFLNFCVRLTKETHLSHVAILTSNTIFIERIYNDARLKETSDFFKIDHLPLEKASYWLAVEGFSQKEINLTLEYLGGSIPRLIKAIQIKKKGKNLQEHLERERWLAYTEIVDFMTNLEDEHRKLLLSIAESIVNNGFILANNISKQLKDFVYQLADKEILFYDPLELKAVGSSRIYEKAFELLLEEWRAAWLA